MNSPENLDFVNIHMHYDISKLFDYQGVIIWLNNIVNTDMGKAFYQNDSIKTFKQLKINLEKIAESWFNWNWKDFPDPLDQYIYMAQNWEQLIKRLFADLPQNIRVFDTEKIKAWLYVRFKNFHLLVEYALKHKFNSNLDLEFFGGYSVTKFLDLHFKTDKNFWDYKSSLEHVEFGIDKLFLDSRSKESLNPSFIGTFVYYLVCFKISGDFLGAFDVPIRGLQIYKKYSEVDDDLLSSASETIEKFKNKKTFGFNLKDLGDLSKLIPYGIYFRSGYLKSPDLLNELTIKNVEVLVNRTIDFLRSLKGEILFGGAIPMTTKLISSGDWDYLVGENLIDLKVTKRSASCKKSWLQLLIYYLLGKNSGAPEFKNVKNLVLFNPNLNDAYFLAIKNIPKYVIDYLWSEMN